MAMTSRQSGPACPRAFGPFPPLTAPFTATAWAAFGYLSIGMVTGLAGLVLMLGMTGAAATMIGLPFLAASIQAARWVGRWQLLLARWLCRVHAADPAPPRARSGGLGWLAALFSDRAGWKALAYLIIKVPLSMIGAAVDALWLAAFAALLYPVWLPAWKAADARHPGRPVAGLQFGHTVLGTWPDALTVAATGAVGVFILAWLVVGTARLDALLVRTLLSAPVNAGSLRA